MTGKRKKDSIYTELPEDVQEAIRILLIYFKLPRIGNPRPLYPKAIKRACRILNIRGDWTIPQDQPNKWMDPNDKHLKNQLRLVGLDPDDVMRVADQGRWNLAWEQLLKTEKFSVTEQQKAIAFGKQASPAQGVMRVFVTPKNKDAPATFSPAPLPGATHCAAFKLPKFT
jgi:hypothetical protein